MSENILGQYIAKIEGHGQLKYTVAEKSVRLELDEGERLFEKLVVGQHYKDIAFITARICGVCPTAHTLAALNAIENAFEVELNDSIKALRRALLSAQMVQSHALHLFFLVAPDYLKTNNVLEINEKYPHIFKVASELKRVGDLVIEKVGGRAVHPVSPTVGGFLSVPDKKEIEKLIVEVKNAQRFGQETLELFAGIRYPHHNRKANYFSLSRDGKIDILGDTLVSSSGVSTNASNYQYIISETVKSYSTAKFSKHEGKGFIVGAIARVNMMELEDFNPKTQKLIKSLGIRLPFYNIYKNNLAQAIELMNYLEEMEKSLTEYLWSRNERIKVGYKVQAAVGVGAVEAPRGTLYHMYEFDDDGIVTRCDIITPTAQNLTSIEDDANTYLIQNKSVNIPRRERELNMLVRAYDPCITCSVH